MNCPQCSNPLIETDSKKEEINTSSLPNSILVGTGVGTWMSGSIPASSNNNPYFGTYATPHNSSTQKIYNCSNCHISIYIDDDKKSKEKKELMIIIEALVDQKKRCDEIVKSFNSRWNDNQNVEKLESLLILK